MEVARGHKTRHSVGPGKTRPAKRNIASKAILLEWSRGAELRRKVLRAVARADENGDPCYQNILAEKFGISHVAMRKHLDLLMDEGLVAFVNPGGKPVYLKPTQSGRRLVADFGRQSPLGEWRGRAKKFRETA